MWAASACGVSGWLEGTAAGAGPAAVTVDSPEKRRGGIIGSCLGAAGPVWPSAEVAAAAVLLDSDRAATYRPLPTSAPAATFCVRCCGMARPGQNGYAPGMPLPLRSTGVVAFLVVGICSNSCSTSNAPTLPSDNVIESWTGLAAVGGQPTQSQHTVIVSNSGYLIVTLVSLTPPLPPGKYAILALGVKAGSPCTYAGPGTVQNGLAQPGTAISVPITAATYCVSVYDGGDFSVNESFEVKISHP
jgi:hypothetical protein